MPGPTAKERVPVTILTGFLGAGKTTLLNRILTEQHGKRIAVIENEFGAVGVDRELVSHADDEIFEMNNGCICCNVRGDLIRILDNLMKRKDKFDSILIETTGLADPRPVAQTFFIDDETQGKLQLDGIVTLVDAKHIWRHLYYSDKSKKQIAFANVVLLNKTDLVSAADLDKLEAHIKSMNADARIYRTQDAGIDLNKVLDLGGFNLPRALEVDPKFLEPEYPFEWGGTFALDAGTYDLELGDGPDPALKMVLVPGESAAASLIDAVKLDAILAFSKESLLLRPGSVFRPSQQFLQLPTGGAQFSIQIDRPGNYALFTQRLPDEFNLKMIQDGAAVLPIVSHEYKPDHDHDEEVSSVGISVEGDLDQAKFQRWLDELLMTQGINIFRSKGILSIKGNPKRFVFQGVHMLFDCEEDRPWGAERRHNSVIFIGRKLDREKLNEGFRACLA